MKTEMVIALISLIGTLGGSISGILISNRLTNYRIKQLEKKVDVHNNFAVSIPLLEEKIKNIAQKLSALEKA